MSDYHTIADICDLVAFAFFQAIDVSTVLNWVYMIVFIISLVLGIVLKIWGAVKDGKVTRDEMEEIKKEVDEDLKKIEEEKEKEDKK